MGIAALAAWVLTALGGFVMLARWVSRGGLRQQRAGATRFPAGLVFSHFGLAALGLVLWVVYLLVDNDTLGWVAFAVLIPVAALGFAMLARWIPVYRGRTVVAAAGPRAGTSGAGGPEVGGGPDGGPAERHLPVPVVVGHGVLAVVTLVLVLLTMLGVGGS
jgi:hypothetical protein